MGYRGKFVAAVAIALTFGAVAAPVVAGETELGIVGGLLWPDNRVVSPGDQEIEPGLGIRAEVLFNERAGWFVDGIWYPITLKNVPDIDWLTTRTGFNLYFKPHTEPQQFYISIGGGYFEADQGSLPTYKGSLASLGIGQRVRATEHNRLRWELRADRTVSMHNGGPDDDVTMLQGLVAWSWGLGVDRKDSDGDGVFDSRDDCPDTPRGATVDQRGCPMDSDGDGVYDGLDKCPNTPQGWPVDTSGCPLDSDGDGVADGADACPNTPRGAQVDGRGCPLDSDGDGVYDGLDKCPNTPRGAKVDASGCPMDSDGDGVYDGLDKCPDTPRGVKVDATGCPTAAPLFQQDRPTLVLEGVFFEFDKAVLTLDSRSVLDGVAESMIAWPEVRVEVAGYTDSKGADAYNLKLSQQRAEAVRDYLAGKGVAAGRLTARGYGKANPIADNDTDAGRAKNRRVELKRLN